MPRAKGKPSIREESRGRPVEERSTPLGRRLTELRGPLTISQAAEKIGVSRMVWHRWETGEREPSYAQLAAIARAFGAKPLDLAAAAMGG